MLLSHFASSQNGTIWHFGIKCGLDFTSGQPRQIYSNIISVDPADFIHRPKPANRLFDTADAYINSSVVTSCDGKVLMYTSGRISFNRYGTIIPKSIKLRYRSKVSADGNVSLALKFKDTIYNIFGIATDNGNTPSIIAGLYFYKLWVNPVNDSVIVVDTGYTKIDTFGVTNLIVTKHSNGKDYWILSVPDSLDYESHCIRTYKLDQNGLRQINTTIFANVDFKDTHLIFSNSGDKIIQANFGFGSVGFLKNAINVFSFNKTTGAIDNKIIIKRGYYLKNDSAFNIYCPAISPNDSFIYFPTREVLHSKINIRQIKQVELYGKDSAVYTIAQNKNFKDLGIRWYGMKLAPDDVIYVNNYSRTTLPIIKNTNTKNPIFNEEGFKFSSNLNGIVGCSKYMPTIYYDPHHLKFRTKILCMPTPILTNLSDTPYYRSFMWYYGDGDSSQGFKGKHTYKQPGQYFVKLKGLNECGAWIEWGDSIKVDSTAFKKLKSIITLNKPIYCKNDSVALKVNIINSYNRKIRLDWQDGSFDSLGLLIFNKNKSFLLSNNNPIKLITSDGCAMNDTLVVNPKVFPVLGIKALSKDTTLCQGQFIDLKASAKGGDSLNYKYSWSDGTSNNHLKVSPKVNTTYAVTIKDGCQDSVQGIIKIKVLDSLKLKISGKDTVCYGAINKISFSALGGKGNYLYSFGGGSYKKDSTITIKCFNDTLIRVSAWDGCSTPAIDSFKIYVVQPPKINVTLMPNKGCEPLLLSAIDSTVSNNYKNSVLRIGSNEYDLPYFSNPIKDTFKAGSYPVNYTIYINNCVFSQKLSDLIVYPKPSPKILPDSFYEVLKDEYKSVALTGINQSNYVNKYMDSFLWSVNQIGYSQNKSIYFPRKDSGLFNVQLKIKSPFGCLDSANARIIIHPQLSVYIPNAITPNQDGLNDGFYPQGMGIKSFKIKLYSRWGQLIFDGKENEKWIPLASETSINVLVYVIDFVDFNGEHKMETGNVSVVR